MADELYTCSVEVLLPLGAGTPKWPSKEIAYAFLHYLPEELLSKADQRAITRDNWASVSAVCGLKAIETDDVRDAHVVYAVGRGRRSGLDGKGGTLALAYLPVSVSSSYRNGGRVGAGLVLMDVDEPWTSEKPYGRRIGFQPVNWHEGCGHATGLSHNPHGGTIMAATYNPNFEGPSQWEVWQLVDRYGYPGVKPEPPTPKPPAGASVPSKIQVLMSDDSVWQFENPVNLR